MFIVVLFKVVKIWKESKCQSIDKWIKDQWYMYAVEYYSYYSAIKKKE